MSARDAVPAHRETVSEAARRRMDREAEANHRELLKTDPDYRAMVAYHAAGGRDPQGPPA